MTTHETRRGDMVSLARAWANNIEAPRWVGFIVSESMVAHHKFLHGLSFVAGYDARNAEIAARDEEIERLGVDLHFQSARIREQDEEISLLIGVLQYVRDHSNDPIVCSVVRSALEKA